MRGSVLVAVQVFLVVGLIVLASSYERLHEALRLETRTETIPASGDGLEQAMGAALARLQTGIPPADDYTCRLRIYDSDTSAPIAFMAHYEKTFTDTWTVRVEVSTTSMTDCPSSFRDVCPSAGS